MSAGTAPPAQKVLALRVNFVEKLPDKYTLLNLEAMANVYEKHGFDKGILLDNLEKRIGIAKTENIEVHNSGKSPAKVEKSRITLTNDPNKSSSNIPADIDALLQPYK